MNCHLISTMYCFSKRFEETALAIVYKTSKQHWGRGYFKENIYYRFEYNGEIIEDRFRHPKLTRAYSINFVNVGDSLIVEFPVNNPQKNKPISLKKLKKE